MTALLAGIADGAIVLAVALAAAAALRRSSAAMRHAILATGIIAALAMPALELLLPPLPVIDWHAPVTAVAPAATLASGGIVEAGTDAAVEPGTSLSWPLLLVIVWSAGAIALGAGLITSLVRLARLRSRGAPAIGRWREMTDELARECGVRRRVELLISDAPTALLVTCGIVRPTIILPATASRWNDERIRVVLLHELAHISRGDAAVQLASELLRVVQWVNPLAWLAGRRLRQESEYACDDAVLSRGVEPTDYATHLLEVARQLSGRHAGLVSTAAIAHPSTLERRIAAMLNRQRHRAPVGRRTLFVAAVVAFGAGLPLAAAGIAPPAQQSIALRDPSDVVLPTESAADAIATTGSAARHFVGRTGLRSAAAVTIAGTVRDQTGGVLPGVRVTLADTQTTQQTAALTNAAGRYVFRDVPPAEYQLSAQLVGFATVSKVMTLGPESTVDYSVTLPIGSLREAIHVACSSESLVGRIGHVAGSVVGGLFPVLSAQQPQTPVRVGGSIKAPRKIKDVKPICPAALPEGDTAIRLIGRITEDGLTADLRPAPETPGAAPLDLVDAVIDAVREWRFTPTLLNNVPVDVEITVEVVFRRS